MANAIEPILVTVEQYRQLPNPDDAIQELHFGMVVRLTRPKMRHAKLQSRLVRLLRPAVEAWSVAEMEVAFRALPEYDLRGADVACVSQVRWDATDDDDNLNGSPELVIEVLPPSNTKTEIHEKAVLCLSSGSQAFWVVDPKRKIISVTTRGSEPVVYNLGERIPLPMSVSHLEVTEIFS